MSTIRDRQTKIYSEYETPKEEIISEGDKLIKELLDKQLDTKISLKHELMRHKQFETPKKLLDETEYLSGQNNLNEFEKQTAFLQNIEELKSAGLDNDEIQLYLDYKNGENYVKTKHKNLSVTVLQTRYNNILNKIISKSEIINQPGNSNAVSRHVQEIAINTKPNSLETKLFKFATSCSSNEEISTKLNHPLNDIAGMEQKLFGHLKNPKIPSLKKRRKKARKFLDCNEEAIISNSTELNGNLSTKWDIKNMQDEQIKPVENTKKQKIYSCSSNRKYTIRNKEIVEITEDYKKTVEESLKDKFFVSQGKHNNCHKYGKLAEEEIRKIPKFKNYEKGIPSNILYIKNLAKQTNESDLVSLFKCSDNRITYRILKGKMAGQAFITFSSIDQATNALKNINGTIIKNKPLVIQYGKKPYGPVAKAFDN